MSVTLVSAAVRLSGGHFKDFTIDGCFGGDSSDDSFHIVLADGDSDAKNNKMPSSWDGTLSSDNIIERLTPLYTECEAIKNAVEEISLN